MKRHIPVASAVALLLGFSLQAFAQSAQRPDPSFTHGESKHCESLSGEAKEQCDREEANKGQPAEAADDAKTSSDAPAAAGSSRDDASKSSSSSSTDEKKSDPRSD